MAPDFHVPKGREGGLSRRGCCGLVRDDWRFEAGALCMQQSARWGCGDARGWGNVKTGLLVKRAWAVGGREALNCQNRRTVVRRMTREVDLGAKRRAAFATLRRTPWLMHSACSGSCTVRCLIGIVQAYRPCCCPQTKFSGKRSRDVLRSCTRLLGQPHYYLLLPGVH